MAEPLALTDVQLVALARYLDGHLGIPREFRFTSRDPLVTAAQAIGRAADDVLHAEQARRRGL